MAFATALTRLPPWSRSLRSWQRDACRSWLERKPENELWVVTPGGGKTIGATRLVYGLLRNDECSQVIFVVPKEQLKEQVARTMSEVGIYLEHRFSNAEPHIPRDMHGVVVTYQQVAAAPSVFEYLVRRKPTVVVFDEIHHASENENSSWGAALKVAFADVRYRLAMSGTPFRSDGHPIPFVEYEMDECVTGFSYDYASALRDGVCRPLVFEIVDGDAEWISRSGQTLSANLDEKIKKEHESERLRTFLLDPAFATAVRSAHETLMRIRNDNHPNAGGLIITMNQQHARTMAEWVANVTGTIPTIIVSEDPDAGEKLNTFAASTAPWVIAVHMVSEGIDIPRLRVGVFATNVKTNMYFRQFCGRFVRMTKGLTKQYGYVYIPNDATIVRFAHEIREEVVSTLMRRKPNALLVDGAVLTGGLSGESDGGGEITEREEPGENFYRPLGANAKIGGSIRGEDIHPIDAHEGAAAGAAAFAESQEYTDSRLPLFPVTNASPIFIGDERAAIKKKIQSLVGQVCRTFKVDQKKIHGTMNARTKGSMKIATVDELRARQEMLLKWIKLGKYDGYR